MRRVLLLCSIFALAACTASVDTPAAPDYGFEQSGTLARNNPGYTPGVWYLVYDAAGQPGLFQRLAFSEDTVCIENGTRSPCERSVFKNGLRVTVRGDEDGGGIMVREMELE